MVRSSIKGLLQGKVIESEFLTERPEQMSVADFAKVIKRLMGCNSEIVFEPLPINDPKVRRPDITKAKEKLGWEPKVDLEEAMKRTIKWFQENYN